MENKRKKAKWLFALWAVTYAIFNIGTNIYVSYQRVVAGYDPTTTLGPLHIWTIGLMVFYFIPLVGTVYRYSMLSDMKKLRNVTRVIIVILSVCSIMLAMFIFRAMGS